MNLANRMQLEICLLNSRSTFSKPHDRGFTRHILVGPRDLAKSEWHPVLSIPVGASVHVISPPKVFVNKVNLFLLCHSVAICKEPVQARFIEVAGIGAEGEDPFD